MDPYRLTHALVAAAKEAGARVYEHSRIYNIVTDDKRQTQDQVLRSVTRHNVYANKVVLASGDMVPKAVQDMFVSEDYSRMIVSLNIDGESNATFAAVEEIQAAAQRYYPRIRCNALSTVLEVIPSFQAMASYVSPLRYLSRTLRSKSDSFSSIILRIWEISSLLMVCSSGLSWSLTRVQAGESPLKERYPLSGRCFFPEATRLAEDIRRRMRLLDFVKQ